MEQIKRLPSGQIVLTANLFSYAGSPQSGGLLKFFLTRLEDDGTLTTFDASDNTFKSGTVTTNGVLAAHRKANNGADNTGIWTAALPDSGFDDGRRYTARLAAYPGASYYAMKDFEVVS